MEETVKEEITVVLELLRKTLMRNGVSMATDGEGNILFFDTATYLQTESMIGFSVNTAFLVK